MKKAILQKYAKLLVEKGVNLQKGQELHLFIGIDQEPLAVEITKAAYKAGASRVRVEWSSEAVQRVHYKRLSAKALGKVEDFELARLQYRVDHLPARLYITSEDPDGMKGLNQKKIAKGRMISYPIIKPYIDKIENKEQWCIAGAASAAWAKKVFPHLSKSKAIEALWNAILETSRMGEDPIAEWNKHNLDLRKRCDYLNSLGLVKLHYQANNGTDLTVGMLENALWMGGSEFTLGSKIEFNPNIPSEEVFTSPKKGEADGIVYASKPLSYQGVLIENFSVRFENGKAVEVHAEKNEDVLKQMIAMDETACLLGECALIPYDSPINNTNILFYETLYDENASCHLALGAGFTNTIKDYDKYTQQELIDMGINDSMIHVDFMIGTEDMNITGIDKNGKEIPIFRNGNWAF